MKEATLAPGGELQNLLDKLSGGEGIQTAKARSTVVMRGDLLP
jgi:hypothetical protein